MFLCFFGDANSYGVGTWMDCWTGSQVWWGWDGWAFIVCSWRGSWVILGLGFQFMRTSGKATGLDWSGGTTAKPKLEKRWWKTLPDMTRSFLSFKHVQPCGICGYVGCIISAQPQSLGLASSRLFKVFQAQMLQIYIEYYVWVNIPYITWSIWVGEPWWSSLLVRRELKSARSRCQWLCGTCTRRSVAREMSKSHMGSHMVATCLYRASWYL